ncbi:YmdB family metallophosphoesterase [Pseudonocardia acaciae]|uniref:YmdB family metallophosphoesterase n=1 Tax=Pseudonocardia acaciae TaxID=551276 RepID=UPI001FDF1119|nr:YmdB family metallophosphoesterase [Pseudonocardia acaciae]
MLFFGDVVGHEATRVLVERIAELGAEHAPDIVVVNAENCAPDGLGMGAEEVGMLLAAGVDVISGGNHSWDDDESVELLENPKVIRPANVPPEMAGRGGITVETADGPVTVVNLVDPRAIHIEGKVRPPYESWLEADRVGTVVVDFHGDHVFDKQVFAHAVDGQAAAVLGTHSHEATTRLHRLPLGTVLVTEVGMTGPIGGVQGFDPGRLVDGLVRFGDPYTRPLPVPIAGPIEVSGVLVDVTAGRATDIRRVA